MDLTGLGRALYLGPHFCQTASWREAAFRSINSNQSDQWINPQPQPGSGGPPERYCGKQMFICNFHGNPPKSIVWLIAFWFNFAYYSCLLSRLRRLYYWGLRTRGLPRFSGFWSISELQIQRVAGRLVKHILTNIVIDFMSVAII